MAAGALDKYSHWLAAADADALPSPEALPPETEVALIGGGIMGVATAYWLARFGVQAVVLETRRLGCGATGRNAGLMLAGARPLEDPELVRSVLSEESIEAGYAEPGHMALAASQEVWDKFQEEAERRRNGARSVVALDHSSCEDLLGMRLNRRFLGGRWLPDGGLIHPVEFVYGLAGAAQRRGVSFFTKSQALEVRATAAQDSFTVHTSRGELRARQVVFACSASLPKLVPCFRGVITPVRGQVMCTQPLPPVFRIGMGVDWGTVYWRQASDGVIVLGGYRSHDPSTETSDQECLNPAIQEALTNFLPDAFPDFPPFAVSRRWAGIMDYSTDGKPAIGRVPGATNQWVIACFGGHGLPGALGAGKALAEAISTGDVPSMLDPYDPRRFL